MICGCSRNTSPTWQPLHSTLSTYYKFPVLYYSELCILHSCSGSIWVTTHNLETRATSGRCQLHLNSSTLRWRGKGCTYDVTVAWCTTQVNLTIRLRGQRWPWSQKLVPNGQPVLFTLLSPTITNGDPPIYCSVLDWSVWIGQKLACSISQYSINHCWKIILRTVRAAVAKNYVPLETDRSFFIDFRGSFFIDFRLNSY